MQCGAGHHLSIPSSFRTFTKKQIKQVLRHLTAVQEFLELKKPYYALLIRKVPKWSRVIIVIPPNLWGFLPFSKGATSWDTWRCQAKPPRPWTMSPSVSLLELVLVQQRVLSPIRHLGSMEGVWGWWYDMIWYDFFDTYTVTCYCICKYM